MRLYIEIKCPECSSERTEARTRTGDCVDERTWFDISCVDRGHKLSYEEIGRRVRQYMLKSPNQPIE